MDLMERRPLSQSQVSRLVAELEARRLVAPAESSTTSATQAPHANRSCDGDLIGLSAYAMASGSNGSVVFISYGDPG